MNTLLDYHSLRPLVFASDQSSQEQRDSILSQMTYGEQYTEAELYRLTGINVPTLAKRLDELIQAGRVEKCERNKICSCTTGKAKCYQLTATECG